MKMFVVQHCYQTSDGREETKMIGVYSSPEMANKAIAINDSMEDGNYFTIGGHVSKSDPYHLYPFRDSDEGRLSIPEVGDRILDPKNGWDRKKPVLAVVCHGSDGPQGKAFIDNLAQYLSDQIKQPVTVIGAPGDVRAQQFQDSLGLGFYWGGVDPPMDSGQWRHSTRPINPNTSQPR